MIALVVADGVISRYLITAGLAQEGNPFMRVWISRDTFLYLKLGGAFLAAFILWRVSRSFPHTSFCIALFFVVVYTVLVLWSLLIFAVSGT